MSRAQVIRCGYLANGSAGACRGRTPRPRCAPPHTLRQLLGPSAWRRLPATVRVRFADAARAVDYAGVFEIVRASLLGRMIAWCCRLLGTPVVPRTGCNVPAVVHVGPCARGVEWRREYRWPAHAPSIVRSTKVIDSDGALIERLPARLCMSLDVFERDGLLHFVSRGYFFDMEVPGTRRHVRLVLPRCLSPGTTHVEHIDEAEGWFRFTMTVSHPLFGELFYQTGRFHALGG